MASSKVIVERMGQAGVNVDKDPLELDDSELVKAQNANAGFTAGMSSLRKRDGLLAFNTVAITAGTVLGGSDLPIRNNSASGVRNLYIGRGPAV